MLEVLTSSFFIILAEHAPHTVLLLLVFCTYALYGTLKILFECGRMVNA